MKRAAQLFLFVGLMLLVSAQAQAQMLAWEDRVFLTVNYAYQNKTAIDLTSSSSAPFYDETALFTSAQTIESKGGMLDFGAGVRVFGNFGVGASFNTISKVGTGTVSAKVPDPLFYDKPRSATANIDKLNHKERALHVMGLFVLPLTDNFDVTVSAGPTFFSLEQDTLNSDVQFGEVGAPYTSIDLTSVTKVTTKKNKVGFNAGVDATFKVTRHIGVGGFVRYAATTIDIKPESGDPRTINVGGIQFGGGLRLRF